MTRAVYLLCAACFLSGASVARPQEFNRTDNTTCQRKDPFDPYIYHAPQLADIMVDGDPSDWEQYGLLEWARIDHWCEGTGQESWPTGAGGWNAPVCGAQDLGARFKAGWGYVDEWPVLYLLVEWIDDDMEFNPEGYWNTSDALWFWYGETLYDYGAHMPEYDYDIPVRWHALTGKDEDYTCRQQQVYLIPDWGSRMYTPRGHVQDKNQPHSTAGYVQVSHTKVYVEAQTQLFGDYSAKSPWTVIPGKTCLAIGIGVFDYDPSDGGFTYLTWGLSNRLPMMKEDVRVVMSTVGFEKPYEEVFSTVENSNR